MLLIGSCGVKQRLHEERSEAAGSSYAADSNSLCERGLMFPDEPAGLLLDQVQLVCSARGFHQLASGGSLHDELAGFFGQAQQLKGANSALVSSSAAFSASRALQEHAGGWQFEPIGKLSWVDLHSMRALWASAAKKSLRHDALDRTGNEEWFDPHIEEPGGCASRVIGVER